MFVLDSDGSFAAVGGDGHFSYYTGVKLGYGFAIKQIQSG